MEEILEVLAGATRTDYNLSLHNLPELIPRPKGRGIRWVVIPLYFQEGGPRE